jgi:hypothetical protein
MVMLTAQAPVVVYQILDGRGRPIGNVVEPKSEPVLGKGQETVLLLRV